MRKDMMTEPLIRRSLLPLLAVCLWIACKNATEPRTSTGRRPGNRPERLRGETASVIRSASIILGGQPSGHLGCLGRVRGFFAFRRGPIRLTCSASGYRDSTMQVLIEGGKTAILNFYLVPILRPDGFSGNSRT